jgi:hypothetical protein
MQVASYVNCEAAVPSRRKALRKRQKPIDPSLVAKFWFNFSEEDRLQRLVWKDRTLVERAFAIQEELRRREQECYSKGIAFKNAEGREVMSVSLACFGFQWNEGESAYESGSSPDVFLTHGVLMSLEDQHFNSYLEQRLGAAFSGKRPVLTRAQWSTIFETMPNSWNDFELQALKLVEQTILTLYVEAETLATSEANKEVAFDDSWIDDELAPQTQPVRSKKKTQRSSPQNSIVKNKIGTSREADSDRRNSASSAQRLVVDSENLDTNIPIPKCREDIGLEADECGGWSTVTRRKQPKTSALCELSDAGKERPKTFALGEVSPAFSEISTAISTTISSATSDSMSETGSTDNVVGTEMPSATCKEGKDAFERGWWIASDIGDSSFGWYFRCPDFEKDNGAAPTSYRAVTKRTFVEFELAPSSVSLTRARSFSADI